MFPYLVLLYQGQVILVPDFLRCPRFLKANLTSKDQGIEGYEKHGPFHVLCHVVPCPTDWWAHVFSSLPLAVVTPVDLFMEHSLPAGPAPVSWEVCRFIFAFIILLTFLTLPKAMTMCGYQFCLTAAKKCFSLFVIRMGVFGIFPAFLSGSF